MTSLISNEKFAPTDQGENEEYERIDSFRTSLNSVVVTENNTSVMTDTARGTGTALMQ